MTEEDRARILHEARQHIEAGREVQADLTRRLIDVPIEDPLAKFRREADETAEAERAETERRKAEAHRDQLERERARAAAETDIDDKVRAAVAAMSGHILESVGEALATLLKREREAVATLLEREREARQAELTRLESLLRCLPTLPEGEPVDLPPLPRRSRNVN